MKNFSVDKRSVSWHDDGEAADQPRARYCPPVATAALPQVDDRGIQNHGALRRIMEVSMNHEEYPLNVATPRSFTLSLIHI